MKPQSHANSSPIRYARRFEVVGLVLLVLTAFVLVFVALMPMGQAELATSKDRSRALKPIPNLRKDTSKVVSQAVRRELIRPAQVIAAVKDDGRAARLLGKLKLQGVLQVQGTMQAYVQVEGQGVVTLREGAAVLEFTVIQIDPAGIVRLSLEGVEVTLSH